MNKEVASTGALTGELEVPGDKSISHRAAILGAIAQGQTHVRGFLEGEDCLHTLQCLSALGVRIEKIQPGEYLIHGNGLQGLAEPDDILDVGNSGTTIRLLAGLLASLPFTSILTGDASIRSRPMDRVIVPLTQMGATIFGRKNNKLAPLSIRGGNLKGIDYQLPVASAQVKSAILLAALGASGPTSVREPLPSRDHTERMLAAFGARILVQNQRIHIEPQEALVPQEILVPGDISSAAFFMVAASIIPGSNIYIRNVGVNPTRTGIITALQAMGASVTIKNYREQAGEPVADLQVQHAPLRGITFQPEWIPTLIDEIPALCAAAACAEGVTVIRHAQELRVKETDRIRIMTQELTKFGVKVQELPDGMIIEGGAKLKGASCCSHGDHRIAMALAVLGLRATGITTVGQAEAVKVSFPDFFETLESLR